MSTSRACSFLALVSLFGLAGVGHAQQSPDTAATANLQSESAQQRDQRMDWWREARFGMFVHWGLYADRGGRVGWKDMDAGRYGVDSAASQRSGRCVCPSVCCRSSSRKRALPKSGRDLAKAAGCKYVVFTNKHHEGFALHDSAVTDV